MKLRIVSDGSGNPRTTQVFNAETGEKVENVRRVEWRHDVDGSPEAVVYVICPPADIVGEATIRDASSLDDEIRRYQKVAVEIPADTMSQCTPRFILKAKERLKPQASLYLRSALEDAGFQHALILDDGMQLLEYADGKWTEVGAKFAELDGHEIRAVPAFGALTKADFGEKTSAIDE